MNRDDTPPPQPPARPADGHKGTFGTVCVVGGCAVSGAAMLGAPALAARAALRAGAGLVSAVVPRPLVVPLLTLLPEATAAGLAVDGDDRVVPHEAAGLLEEALEGASACALGPGLGPGHEAEAVAQRVLGQDRTPVVVDADALNALARIDRFTELVRAPAVLTPHPGEFRRLADRLGVSAAGDRERDARSLAQRVGAVVVLKGAGTVVSDGLRAWTCARGHPCLAVGGTGDVLCGLIAGVAAQFVAPGPRAVGSVELPRPPGRPLDLFDAARIGVEAHAIAGERWAADREASGGLLAHELADLLPGVLESMRR